MPIVIRNAEVIAERNSSTFNPGSVDVAVYPPIPVDDWTTENLDERIAEVRQLYLDTLKDWPQDELPSAPLYAIEPRTPAKKAPAKKAAARRRRPRRRRRRRRLPPRRLRPSESGSRHLPRGAQEGPAVKVTADALHSFTPTDDALVLASVDSPAEAKMLDDWLAAQRREHPDARIEVLQLPGDDEPPPPVSPVSSSFSRSTRTDPSSRCACSGFPAACPPRSKVVAFLSGRDTYRPPKLLQRGILRKDASRARVVAGEPAKVAELRQQLERHHRRGEPPRLRAIRDAPRRAGDRPRRAAPARAPSTSRRGWSSRRCWRRARFREGLEKIPGATLETAGEMLDELATGWSRFSVDLIPTLGRAIFSRGFDPNIDYDRAEIEAMRGALENHPAVLLFSHRSYLDGAIVPVAMQENRLPPVLHVRRASTCRSVSWAR